MNVALPTQTKLIHSHWTCIAGHCFPSMARVNHLQVKCMCSLWELLEWVFRPTRPRQKLLDWMMSEEYSKLKEEAQHLETWNHWRSGPARGRELKEEVMENSKK